MTSYPLSKRDADESMLLLAASVVRLQARVNALESAILARPASDFNSLTALRAYLHTLQNLAKGG